MAEAVVGIVLENLISFAGKEVGLFLGFNQEKEKLESMFTAIKATLQDAEEKQFSKEGAKIKDWLRKIKDVAYKLDDILDECAYEVLRLEYQGVKFGLPDKVQRSCLSFFDPKHVAFRYKIAKKMKRISERLKEIYEERTQFHLTDLAVQNITSGVPEWRQTMASTIEPQVYGREEDTKEIVTSLIEYADASENLLVYPIVGQGGLGKTTLAQLIYKDERVVDYFELRMWVCVSEDFSCSRMIKAIIKEASRKDCEDSDLEPLRKTLQDQLRSKRYLLVLDDVWDDKRHNWQTLRSVLDCGAKGASILVTTRLSKVASIMGTVMNVGELSKLSDNDCWDLFKHQAFAPNEEEHAELVVIGKEIVKKCGGVPLAAKALGGLLRFKRKKIEWLNVKESNLLQLPHNDENSIMPALILSYLNLPVKLRPCFAYCAIFPKDTQIKKQYLIELWMANGFTSSEGRLDAEDVGDNVWHELYWRSFFQDIERDETGQVTSFKMHDLVHDLAESIAENVCCITTDNGVTTVPETIQHISDHRPSKSDELINSLHQVKSLRTYICQHDGSITQFPARTLKRYPLRVLRRKRIEELSSSIGDLKHLRYLNLSSGKFETLPESLGKLWNMLILKLDYCKNLRRLPDSLVHLKALQQLSLNWCNSLSSLAPQIGKLSSLRILSKYIVDKERGFLLSELGPLKLKGDLRIEHLEKVKSIGDAKEANMSIKQLNRLELSWKRYEEEWELQENMEEILEVLQPDTQHLKSLFVRGYKGVHFPQWMSSPSLKKLSIVNCIKVEVLDEALQHMTALKELILGNLPNLESLPDCIGSLPLLERLEISWCEKLRCLPTSLSLLTSLVTLRLVDLPNLESLPDCIGSLPLLDFLHIGECEKLRCLPTSLSLLTSLKKLSLWSLPNLESLPDCIGSLSLLEELWIRECEKLRCLPTSLSLLASLKYLEITGCPELIKKRCEKETGQDWPKIAHIPHIKMDNRWIR